MSAVPPVRVLVVEDDVAMGELMQLVLEHQGFKVQSVVRSGAAALQCIARDPCDIAIVDLELPDMAGVTLLSELRRCAPDVRRIVCSAHAADSPVVAAAREFADGVVPKHDFAQVGLVAQHLTRPLRPGTR